jgi:Tfp pilus assembly pilus retraction ATPase PilT
MGVPFITVEELVESFRPLKSSEQQVAEWFIQVASDWIWERKPTISETSVAAKLVVTEVVSNALRFGKYGPLRSFTEQTSHSMMSGTLTDAANNLDFTDRHREMLGIPIKAGPVYSFPVADY